MEFEYVVLDKEGKRVKSVMTAESAAMVAAALRNAGSKPLEIIPVKEVALPVKKALQLFPEFKRVTTKELTVFTRQFGTIINAGVLLTEAMTTISDDLENKYFAKVLEGIIGYINAGENLSSAMSHYPKIFTPYYLAVVSSGEEVGRLGQTVVKLADFMEADEKMRLKFIAAVRYPIFLMSFVFLIVSGIVLFLIPKFKSIFEGAGVQLPLLTRVVVSISAFSLHYFVFIIVAAVVIGVVIRQFLQIFRIRFVVDYALLRVPLIGKVIRKAIISRFCQTLSMLLEGGVGIITALSLASRVMGNLFLKATVEDISNRVVGGSSLSDAMKAHEDMPRIMVKMVGVGEKSGMLDPMLKRLGDYYDMEVETFLNNINSILEPAFIIIIGGVVLVVALALYLPIFEMSSAVH